LLFDAEMAGVVSTDLVREDKLFYNVQQGVQAVLDNAIEEQIAAPAAAAVEGKRQEALDQLNEEE